jgi:hypothetical protein
MENKKVIQEKSVIKAHYTQLCKCYDETHYYVKLHEFWKISKYNLHLSIHQCQNDSRNWGKERIKENSRGNEFMYDIFDVL